MADHISFEGRVAIVTGGGRGLGRAYALELARRGARVVVNSRPRGGDVRATADLVVDEIRAAGGEAVASVESVAEAAGPGAIAQTALDAFGRIDVLVNNAGTSHSASIDDLERDDLLDVLAIHVAGAAMLSKAVFPSMRAQGYGRIVNTSSHAGTFGRRLATAYGAAKAGLIGLTNILAIEGEEHGILANAVLPVAATGGTGQMPAADVERFMTAMGSRAGHLDLEYVTPLVAYLASEACTLSKRSFSAMGGHFAEVVTAITPGWCWTGPGFPTAEAVGENLATISNRDGLATPPTMLDAFAMVTARFPGDARR